MASNHTLLGHDSYLGGVMRQCGRLYYDGCSTAAMLTDACLCIGDVAQLCKSPIREEKCKAEPASQLETLCFSIFAAALPLAETLPHAEKAAELPHVEAH